MQHRFLAWQNAQAEDYYHTLLAGAPSRLEGALGSYHPQLLTGALPDLEGTLPSHRPQLLSLASTAEKEVQTDIVIAARGRRNCKTEVDAQVMMGDGALGVIQKLKVPLVDAVADVYPALRGQCGHCHEPMVLAKLAFELLINQKLGVSRTSLLDIIVLCVAEARGCSSRVIFDDGLQEVFGDSLDLTWHSRLHNSVFHVLRANGIPCFSAKAENRAQKRRAVVSATACGEMSASIGSIALAEGETGLSSAVPATVLWLGPEC
jgi:hypothetical protein